SASSDKTYQRIDEEIRDPPGLSDDIILKVKSAGEINGDEEENDGIMKRKIRNGMLSTINCSMQNRSMKMGCLKTYMNRKTGPILMSN
ncbi:15935_t:CDS:1, partial [Racocetra persica]